MISLKPGNNKFFLLTAGISWFIMNFMKAHTSTVTMKEIAEKAGVSQATVSRVLNNHPSVSPAKRKKVMEWVRKLDFEPNYSAKSLAQRSSQLIGIVLPDMQNPYFTELLYHIERITSMNGYNIIVCNSCGDLQKEKSIIRSLRGRQVDGILIGVANPQSEILSTLRREHLKTVLVTQNQPGVDSVAISHITGGELAANHLLSNEVEDFIYFGHQYDEKYIGFRDYLLKSGVADENIRIVGNQDWYFSTLQRGGTTLQSSIRSYDSDKKLGIFTVSDMYAVAALQAAKERGMRIPEDISIVGFDNIFLCEAVEPQLTSISQPIEQIASSAIDLLLQKIENEEEQEIQHIIMQHELVRRDT